MTPARIDKQGTENTNHGGALYGCITACVCVCVLMVDVPLFVDMHGGPTAARYCVLVEGKSRRGFSERGATSVRCSNC